MKLFIRTSLALLALTLAVPAVSFAQGTCPSGYKYQSIPGGGFECLPESSGGAPEISASASGAGLVLVVGMAMIIRGRKRFQKTA